MLKNTSSQKIAVFAFDTTTSLPKTGDAANISVYVSKDYGAVTQLGDTSATEMDSTNAKGWYLFDLTQAETNADALLFTGKSSTANISVVGQLIYTLPGNFSTLSVDGSGRVDVGKVAGTAQTARDLGANLDAAVSTVKAKTDNLPSDPADASDIAASFSTVNSTLSTIAGYVDTEVAAIKAKTDQLAFTSGKVDANIVSVKGTTVNGSGTGADPWGP